MHRPTRNIGECIFKRSVCIELLILFLLISGVYGATHDNMFAFHVGPIILLINNIRKDSSLQHVMPVWNVII